MIFSLSRFLHTNVDFYNYPTIIMRIRKPSVYDSNRLVSYRFNKGDNIRRLAYKFYGHPELWWAILDANPQYQTEFEIKVGDILKIPPAREVAEYAQ